MTESLVMPDRLSDAILVRIHRKSSPKGFVKGFLKGKARRIMAFGRVEVKSFVPLFLEAFDIHPESNHRLSFSWPLVGVSEYTLSSFRGRVGRIRTTVLCVSG